MTNKTNCDTRPPMPAGSLCNTPNCLVEFDGYWWWTNYPFNISGSGYWFNNQQWDPRLVNVDSKGLHLRMQQTMIPGAPQQQWSSTEVLLWGKSDQPNGAEPPKRFYPGYGTYLVAASTNGSFNTLANNCCFGAFIYRFDTDGSQKNAHHELDLVEISRWGNLADANNAQFTLQPWDAMNGNVHRIALADEGKVTLVMNWPGPKTPVTFSVYYGIYTLATLPAMPDITWTTVPEQNIFIPDDACQTVHLNLWREPADRVYPNGNQEVVIEKFEYKP